MRANFPPLPFWCKTWKKRRLDGAKVFSICYAYFRNNFKLNSKPEMNMIFSVS